MRVDETKKAHAEYSASGAHRWINCPGSIQLSRKVPPAPTSEAAEEGTTAHEALEKLMRRTHSIQAVREEYGALMTNHALTMVDYVLKARKGKLTTLLVEQKVDNSKAFGVEAFGTLDCGVIEPYGTLEIIDYKYGKWPVSPKENEQLLYYAYALATQYDFDFQNLKLTIIQPRVSRKRADVSWSASMQDLINFGELAKSAVKESQKASPAFNAHDDWCFFCPAKKICPAQKQKRQKYAREDFA